MRTRFERSGQGVYRRVPTSIWEDPDVKSLRKQSRDAFELWLYVLTCPHSNLTGLFRLPVAYASDDLGWDSRRVRAALVVLKKAGLIDYDTTAEVIWVPAIIGWQPVENQKQSIGAVRQLYGLPDTHLLECLMAAIKPSLAKQDKQGQFILGPLAEFLEESLPLVQGSERVAKPSANPYETDSKPESVISSQLQNQGQEQYTESGGPSSGPPKETKTPDIFSSQNGKRLTESQRTKVSSWVLLVARAPRELQEKRALEAERELAREFGSVERARQVMNQVAEEMQQAAVAAH